MFRISLIALSLIVGCDTAGFKRSYLALDSEGNRKRDTFFTDSEAIFCVAELASGVEDTTVQGAFELRAIFSPENGQKEEFRQFIGSAEVVTGAGEDLTASFEFLRTPSERPYLAGEYACRLYLNGVLESELLFAIRFPECPIAPLESGFRCAGFVLAGQTCAGPTGESCVCGTSGLWECS